MNEYAIYLRKSRADLALETYNKFDTLENHERTLKQLALDRGLTVTKIYREVVSGESIDSRPEMLNLLDDIYANKFDGVLVVEVERLARGDTMDQGRVAEAFKMTNTLIITPMKTYDPNNEYDEEYFEFGLFMSRREFKTIRRRMSVGVQTANEKGYFLGRIAPYGYEKHNPSGKIRTLKIVEEEAKYVRMIYDWFVDERITSGVIARRLTQMGVPTRLGDEWDRSTIDGIIKNPVYKGCVRWANKKTVKVMEDGKVVKKRIHNDNPKIYKGIHEPLVSEEKWEIAQTLFTHPKITFERTPRNPLSGLLKCAKCGRTIIQRYDSRRVHYRYNHELKSHCKMPSSTQIVVIDALINGLNKYIDDFKVKLTNDNEIDVYRKHAALIKAMEEEHEKLKNKHKKIFDFFERELYTEEEFIERKKELNIKIKESEMLIEKEKANAPKSIDYEEKILQFSKAIEMLKDDSISAKDKNIFLKSFIEKITYYKVNEPGKIKGKVTLEIFLK